MKTLKLKKIKQIDRSTSLAVIQIGAGNNEFVVSRLRELRYSRLFRATLGYLRLRELGLLGAILGYAIWNGQK